MQATTSAGRDKGYKGLGMEGPIARWYAKTTQKDLGEFRRLAGRLAGWLGPGAAALEVFDVAGRRVFGRELGALGAGLHRVGVGRDVALAPGVYAVRLRWNGEVREARAVVLR